MSRAVHIPVLETERLRLRGPQAEDYDVFAAFMASERSHFVGGPSSDWAYLRRMFGHIAGLWVLRGYGPFLLETKSDGFLQGMVALWNPIGWPEPELGWSLWAEKAEGKGYAFEAAKAVLAYGSRAHGLTRLVSYIAPHNIRSIQLAERLGAWPDETAERPYPDALVYRHPASGVE